MASFKEIVVVLLVVGAAAALGQRGESSQETSGEKGETTGLRQQEKPLGPIRPHRLVRREGPIFPVGPNGQKGGEDWDLVIEERLPKKGADPGGLPVHRNARSARSAGPPGPAMSADVPPSGGN